MTRTPRTLAVAALFALAACGTSPESTAPGLTSDNTQLGAASTVSARVTFDCIDQGGVRPYAIYNARGILVGNQPMNTRTYRPFIGDTLSKRSTSLLMSPAKYPGWPQYNVWNVTGGPAVGTTNYFFLLFPKVLPGPGGVFPAELHVQFNKGQAGWIQAIETCTVQ